VGARATTAECQNGVIAASDPTQLSVSVTLLVLLAGVLHAIWNAIAKTLDDSYVSAGLIGASSALVAVIALPFTGLPSDAALPYVLISTALHIAYTFALMQSYRLGDFGHTYPIARGTSPLLVAVGGFLFASQDLAPVQIAGVALVAAGLMALVLTGGKLTRADLPATVAALVTGVMIASYTVSDGLGVRHAHNSGGYITLLFLLQGPILAAVGWTVRRHDRAWRSPRVLSAGLGAGVISVAAYGIVIWAQAHGPFALVSALRETSVISAAVIATVFFKEAFGWRRIPPSVTVVLGIILINL
jgi:drug/metabolite transporter (DMT)-like permease